LAIVVYCTAVILPLQSRIEEHGVAGSVAKEQLLEEVKLLMQSNASLARRLTASTEETRQQVGTLRFVPPGVRAPRDDLLRAVQELSRQLGVELLTVTPLGTVRSALVTVEGLSCLMLLKREQQYSALLEALRKEPRSANAMVHMMSLTKDPHGLKLQLQLTLMTAAVKAGGERAVLPLDGLHVQRSFAPNAFDALLTPRPPPPAKAPLPAPLAPKPTPAVAAAPPPPPPPPAPPAFTGKLVGLTAEPGVAEFAVLDVGGSQQNVARGQSINGWVLTRLFPNGVELQCQDQKVYVYFSDEDRPPSSDEAAPAQVFRLTTPPVLGLSGAFRQLSPDTRLPSPFDTVTRAVVVTRVEAGTPAYRAGLREGDLVLVIEGVPVRQLGQLAGIRARLATGKPVRLSVGRNRSLLEVPLSP
jgi:hypothetical protein